MTDKQRFFNSMADTWDDISTHAPEKLETILDMAGIRQGDRVLDVGTGTGVLIPFLCSRVGDAGEITAVDMAERMIGIAQKKYPYRNVRYVCGDAMKLGYGGEFDAILCYSVFPHFEDQPGAVENLAGYLKAGGRLTVCHTQSREHINQLHGSMPGAVCRDHLPDMAAMEGFFAQAGLDVIRAVDDTQMYVVVGQKREP